MDNVLQLKKVAIVEDDEPILDAIQMVLENQEWKVLPFGNGEDFLDSYAKEVPDCLVLDPNLPGINGVEVLTSLGQIEIPVIILTAHPNSPQIDKLLKLGAVDVLVKPITEDALVERVKACLTTRP